MRMTMRRAAIAFLSVCFICFFNLYMKSESTYCARWRPFSQALVNLTRLTPASDVADLPDGFVYITGHLHATAHRISDPLFPEWTIWTPLLSRLVQVCRPRAASNQITLKRPVATNWVDEALLDYPADSDPLPIWYRSANFSDPPQLMGLNFSDDLLNHGLFELTLRLPSGSKVTAANLSAFPGGWFFASNTFNSTRPDDASDPMAQMAGLFLASLAFQIGHRRAGGLMPDDARYTIMQNCRKGDIRIRQFFLGPGRISVLAWKSGALLVTRIVGEARIGAIRKGIIAPERMFDLQLAEEISERTKYRWLLLLTTMLLTVLGPRRCVWRMTIYLAVGIAVGMGRAMIWNTGLWRVDVWVALMCIAYAVTAAVWKWETGNPRPRFWGLV
jgi:hypothetical protein